MAKPRRYWDSAAFLAWLKPEPGRVDKCRTVIDAAAEGEVEILTSALTLAEVLWPRGGDRIPEENRKVVREFFKHEYIVVVQVDRRVAEQAQELVWSHGVRPKDAIHLASALIAKVPFFDTFDDDLLALNGKLGNNPVLRIGHPWIEPPLERLQLELKPVPAAAPPPKET